MGGNATDGCGEFMPSGDEGTLEALTWLRLPVATGISIGKKPKVGATTDNININNNNRMGRKVYLGHRYLGQDNNSSLMGYHPP
ncbi:zinc-finger homeodomain protein 4 [Phtheirospermum japonicum]|uniref:Zinc-finger homeodomain protein 4 n=1 Tax=Phtheirospermum japonicum TaxID=374723 RepID=A0A830B620_9LAMI|nr:zinc-finger homeodomain protein 4 [Phtheirospermum japonicum]